MEDSILLPNTGANHALPMFCFHSLFLGLMLICIAIGILYHNVVSKKDKSIQDILRRKKYISILSYAMAACIILIPFIIQSWDVNILGKYKYSEYISNTQVIIKVIRSGAFLGIIVTAIVFLADNILSRIASPIFTTEEARELDTFCLYLRSFSKDNSKQEKLICRVAKRLYPVYAIGDPNSVLQPNGAQRIYATDDEWKDIVNELSLKSKLILLRIGQTNGTLWEITNVLNLGLIHKTIFLAYNNDDFRYFSSKMKSDFGLMTDFADEISTNPIAFFWDVDNRFWYKIVNKEKEIESLINEYLAATPSLDNEYEMELELRNHNLRYMFDEDMIPSSVRRSLNWGVISPIVNMRHWSWSAWGLFLGLPAVISIILFSQSHGWWTIPINLSALFLFLFGNRIEWAAGSWSSDTMFLKSPKREAKLLWFCIIMGAVYSYAYYYIVNTLW